MSAIFGIVAPLGGTTSTTDLSHMANAYTSRYAFDRIEMQTSERVALGCMQQWVTHVAITDANPHIDSEAQLMLVASAILDNRTELAEQLGWSTHDTKSLSDIKLIASAYLRWGESFVERLTGHFAIVLHDSKRDVTLMIRDPMGAAALSYAFLPNGHLLFATSPRGLRAVLPAPILDESLRKYFTFGMKPREHETYQTFFKDILYVPPAHVLKVHNGQLSFNHYWQPKRGMQWLKATDEDIADEFIRLFDDATRNALRSIGSVGIMLSGGLDSTAVAAMAAPMLKQRDKTLFSYTYVPLADFPRPANQLIDERPYVEALLEKHPHIEPTWIDALGHDGFNTIDRCLDIFEQPYVFFATAPWILECYASAQRNGNRVILNGKNGNGSISFGTHDTVYSYYRQQRKWWTLLHEITHIRRIHQRTWWNSLKFVNRTSKVTDKMADVYASRMPFLHMFLNDQMLQKMDWAIKREPFKTPFDASAFLSLPEKIYQRGEIHTALGLHYCNVTRDPTANIRLMEFIYSLPYDQFVKHGVHKHLLRRTMGDRLPSMILQVKRKKGVQSADWAYRLRDSKAAIYEAFRSACEQPLVQSWLSQEMLNISFYQFEQIVFQQEPHSLIMRLITIDRYIRKN